MTTGHRRLADLPRDEALRLLGSVPVGRIVFTWRAMPAIRVVNHMLDQADIIIRSHSGTAVVSAADAGQGVVVAYEADAIDAGDHLGWSVVVVGLARLVRDPMEVARYQRALRPWLSGEMDQVLRIRPEIVTGYRLEDEAAATSVARHEGATTTTGQGA